MPQPVSELSDIQAIVRSGFSRLDEAAFLLLRVKDPAEARAWLTAVIEEPSHDGLTYRVTHAADLETHQERALQVAITAPGLRSLGAPEDMVRAFSREFRLGLSGEETEAEGRSRRLGDIGENAPSNWEWGGKGEAPDVLVMLYAEAGGLASFQQAVSADLALGFDAHAALVAACAPNDAKVRREPFGFVDGVSQPAIDWEGRRRIGTSDDLEYGNLVAAGEFLLGYENEYGFYTERPLLDPAQDPDDLLAAAEDNPARRDLGRNGAYLVFRQLEQDVSGFWRFAAATSPEDDGVGLAEAMVGRRLATGDPLITASDAEIRGVGPDALDIRQNGFSFDSDPKGLACPFGAHIRRANPRTGDIPGGRQSLISWALRMIGLKRGGPREDLLSSSRLHRIIRRGRAYGAVADREAALRDGAHDSKSGLYFIALNANLSRQFEFIQNAWIANAKFNGLTGETDPLLGNRLPSPIGHATDGFTAAQPCGPSRRIAGLPQFITVRGGAYFFLPSLRALRFLARQGGTG